MVHVALFEGRMAIECMSAGFFKIYENLSAVIGIRNSKIILDDNNKIGSTKTHIMLQEIELCGKIFAYKLGKNFLFYKIDEYSAGVDDDTNHFRLFNH